MRIGVLASQGAFIEHQAVLSRLGVEAVLVRLPEELEGLDGLIIPGGESTTIRKMMDAYGLTDAVADLARKGLPIFGTCAGMVLLSEKTPGCFPEPLGLMGIEVKRNAFGRQKESFETDLSIPALGEEPFHAVFIRAPAISRANGRSEILARLEDGTGVAARQGKILVSAFHPELTDDLRLHRYFLDIIRGKR